MDAEDEIHRAVATRLAEMDQRYTANRRTVVGALVAAEAPLTLPDLLAARPALSQSSTYRNLSVLEEAGVVRRLVHGPDHARYELDEQLTEHHHHLVCRRCGVVWDFTLDTALERQLEEAFDGAAVGQGFAAHHHSIDIYGHCADCG